MTQWRELPCGQRGRDSDRCDDDWGEVRAALDNQHDDWWAQSKRVRGVGWFSVRKANPEEEEWYPHVAHLRPESITSTDESCATTSVDHPVFSRVPSPTSEWALQLRDLCLGVSGGGVDSTPVRLFFSYIAPSLSLANPTRNQRHGRTESPVDDGRLVLVAVCFSGRGGCIARLAALTSSKKSFKRRDRVGTR